MLDLIWSAEFQNNYTIHQFNNDNQSEAEHLFKEVLDHKEKLIRFSLLNVNTNGVYTVDLVRGRLRIWPPIHKKGAVYSPPEKEVQGDKGYDYRLIYFRRVTHILTSSGNRIETKVPSSTLYFLGFQYKDETGKNIKKMIQINKDDEVYIV